MAHITPYYITNTTPLHHDYSTTRGSLHHPIRTLSRFKNVGIHVIGKFELRLKRMKLERTIEVGK